jgi:hypothetical protein
MSKTSDPAGRRPASAYGTRAVIAKDTAKAPGQQGDGFLAGADLAA